MRSLLRYVCVLVATGFSVSSTSTLHAQAIANGSFETPDIGPATAASATSSDWLFETLPFLSGTTANGSVWTAGSPSTTYGTRVMYIQGAGYARQSIFASTASTCTVSFVALQRFYNQDSIGIRLQLELDSTLVWSGIPVNSNEPSS